MERFGISRLFSRFADMDGAMRSADQSADNQPPAIQPPDERCSINEFASNIGDHSGQENPLHAAEHSLPADISAAEREKLSRILDKMTACLKEGRSDCHARSNDNTPHPASVPSSEAPANAAQDDTPWIDPRISYWYCI